MGNQAGNELEALRAKVADLEIKNKDLAEKNRKASGGFLEEIRKKSQINRKSTGSIPYKITCDYIPLTMYHTNGRNIGKPVGPMHPDSAEVTYMRFFHKDGVILSVNKPTDVEVEAYMQTDEYKDLASKEAKRRGTRSKSVKESSIDRLSKTIEKLSGQKVVNTIKKQEDVK